MLKCYETQYYYIEFKVNFMINYFLYYFNSFASIILFLLFTKKKSFSPRNTSQNAELMNDRVIDSIV